MQNRTLSPYRSAQLRILRRSKMGFTLVELLVVLVIIGMLASMVSFAMFRSMQAAREAKTQALIAKLHNVIARHWDTFETGQPPSGMTVAQWMADEMPCTKAEFENSQNFIMLFDRNDSDSITDTYVDEKGDEQPESPIQGDNAAAQCLYQIVLLLADDDLDRINLFSEDEAYDILVTDTDGDGKLDAGDGTPDYFIDGWGQPIGFIREPSGFKEWTNPPDDPTATEIAIPNPSDINDPTAANLLTNGTGLYFPLIYSTGPDKKSGLRTTTGPDNEPPGAPKKKDEDEAEEWEKDNYETYYLDNIHNHRMNARLQ